MLIPCQIARTARRVICRVLGYIGVIFPDRIVGSIRPIDVARAVHRQARLRPVRGVFGDPLVRVLTLRRRQKKGERDDGA